MAENAKRLVKANGLQDVIHVIRGKIEEVELPEKVDVIISEPMGVMLVHERMMESFILGRERFLKPATPQGALSCQMFPSSGSIYVAPFSDISLYADAIGKIGFWNNKEFYGVDLTSLLEPAAQNQFGQAIVGPIDPKTILAPAVSHPFDFATMRSADFCEFTIPFDFVVDATGLVHGIAAWFDVLFDGSKTKRVLSTSPDHDLTHWYQVRYLLPYPIAVNRGQRLTGQLQAHANDQRSVDLQITVKLEGADLVLQQEVSLQDQQYWNLGGNNNVGAKESMGIYSQTFTD
jgi:histone-arginine methyltransferase CARM1